MMPFFYRRYYPPTIGDVKITDMIPEITPEMIKESWEPTERAYMQMPPVMKFGGSTTGDILGSSKKKAKKQAQAALNLMLLRGNELKAVSAKVDTEMERSKAITARVNTLVDQLVARGMTVAQIETMIYGEKKIL